MEIIKNIQTMLCLLALLFLSQGSTLASTDEIIAQKGGIQLLSRTHAEDGGIEIIILENGKEYPLLTYYDSGHPIVTFLSESFLIHNGGGTVGGLYLYDLKLHQNYLINIKTKGASDQFSGVTYGYHDFKPNDSKLYVKVGLGDSGFTKFCIYDLAKLASLVNAGNLNEFAKVLHNYGGDTPSLVDFMTQQKVTFCTFDFQFVSETNFEWLGENRIRFAHMIDYQKGNIYEANWDGSDLKKVGVQVGDQLVDLFRDMDEAYPLYGDAYVAKAQGWLTGYPDGTVRLENTINRAELAKMAIKAFGKEEVNPGAELHFPDVPLDAWYAPTLYTALQLGAVTGYPDGTAKPERPVNRAEALKVVLTLLGKDYGDTSEQYADTLADAWYGGYTAFSKTHGLIPEDEGGNLHPAQELTRGEAVGLITRVLELR